MTEQRRRRNVPPTSTTNTSTDPPPYTDSPAREDEKPMARPLDHLVSTESLHMNFSAIRVGGFPDRTPKTTPLGAAPPSPDFYPWQEMIFPEEAPFPENMHPLETIPEDEILGPLQKRHGESYNLAEWLTRDEPGGSKTPRVLYTIPTGHNPTSCCQSTDRRRSFYKFADKHDLVIIEDDPYYFINMSPLDDQLVGDKTDISCETVIADHPPSYFSLDISGRVIRFDSASPIFAPGLQIGWITAASTVIDQYLPIQEAGSAPNGLSQLLLTEHFLVWGNAGFTTWLVHQSKRYQKRRDILLKACNLHFLNEIAHWATPEFGMFVWIKVDWKKRLVLRAFERDDDDLETELQKLETRVEEKARAYGVLVAKGSLCSWNKKLNGELRFRLTFAAADTKDIEEGVRRFSNALRTEFSLPEMESLEI
ncbi:pyridoxal phosphate-dependent transferase [Aspergillus crustosus]